MEEKNKRRIASAAALAAGLGTYALARAPIGGVIRKSYGKALEPVVMHTKDLDPIPFFKSMQVNPKKVNRSVGRLGPNELLMGLIGEDTAAVGKLSKARKAVMGSLAQRAYDKGISGRLMYKHRIGAKTVEFTPKQVSAIQSGHRDLLSQKKDIGASSVAIEEASEKTIKRLNRMFGKNKYFIKPRKEYEQLETSTGPQSASITSKNYLGPTMWEFLKHPKRFIVQHKMPIERELRVTALNDKIVDIYPLRYNYDQWALGGHGKLTSWEAHKHIAPLIKKHHEAMGLPRNRPAVMSFDVAKLKSKGAKPVYKIVESNIGMSGGQLEHPRTAAKLYKRLTGKDVRPVAAAKAVVAAGTAGFLTKRRLNEKQENTY